MVFWILLALIVYYVGLFTPALFSFFKVGLTAYMGSRDGEPAPEEMHARTVRMHRNAIENYAPFLALAILSYVVPNADQGQALFGAQLFVIARIIYMPLYIFAVPYLRSVTWIVGLVGLLWMAFALI